jgi:adenylosuccinate lyase
MDQKNTLLHISPIDGRYHDYTKGLQKYFSEYALINFRLFVEIKYLLVLLTHLKIIDGNGYKFLESIITDFNLDDSQKIKEIEKTTNHDIKAIECFIQNKCIDNELSHIVPFIHFGLTSQDINNTAIPLSLKAYIKNEYMTDINEIIDKLEEFSISWQYITILSHTHGQPASPTSFGKEMKVFSYRLKKQVNELKKIKYWSKFGGTVGNFNAHIVAYPNINWVDFSNKFINSIGLERNIYTTQIDNYENLSVLFDCIVRINTILVDMCRDIWSYISMEYIICKAIKGEIGSSTIPHKVNPIHFENAEGNLLLSNSIFTFLSQKLPISRLQRDLTDSTVLRNVGVAFGYVKIAFTNIMNGLNKIDINIEKINTELDNNWIIISEAIQSVLRKYNYIDSYELLKKFNRENKKISRYEINTFINELDIPIYIKQELLHINPYTYSGYSGNYAIYENLKTDKTVITTIV